MQVFTAGSKIATIPLPNSPPLCITASVDGTLIAVGTEDLKTLVYDAKDLKELKLLGAIELRAPASALALSPDSKYLAIGLSTGKIPLSVFQSHLGALELTTCQPPLACTQLQHFHSGHGPLPMG